MIDHNLKQLKMDEDYEGEQIIPSEKGNLTLPSTLRQFIIQSRAYREETLELLKETDGLHLRKLYNNFNYSVPFFYISLIVRPNNGMTNGEFVEKYGNEFFDLLLNTIGRSEIRNNRGNRGSFVGEFFNFHDPDYGQVLKSHILIGTSVFYNDYRVTTNFPSSDNEMDYVLTEIYNIITRAFPQLDIEINHEIIEDDIVQETSSLFN